MDPSGPSSTEGTGWLQSPPPPAGDETDLRGWAIGVRALVEAPKDFDELGRIAAQVRMVCPHQGPSTATSRRIGARRPKGFGLGLHAGP